MPPRSTAPPPPPALGLVPTEAPVVGVARVGVPVGVAALHAAMMARVASDPISLDLFLMDPPRPVPTTTRVIR